VEVQAPDQLTAARELHRVPAAVVGEDLLVLRVVADALEEIVVVDDQRGEPQLLGPERGRRAKGPASDDEHVEHGGERDGVVEDQHAVGMRLRPRWGCSHGGLETAGTCAGVA
jgi:hypothetical protein